MKKLLYFLFISLFIISVSSCEKDDDVQPETPTTKNQETQQVTEVQVEELAVIQR